MRETATTAADSPALRKGGQTSSSRPAPELDAVAELKQTETGQEKVFENLALAKKNPKQKS